MGLRGEDLPGVDLRLSAGRGIPRCVLTGVGASVLVLMTACSSDHPAASRLTGPSSSSSSVAASASSSAATPTPAATDPDAAAPLIDHVQWVTTTSGKQLRVIPTSAGRTDQFPTALARAWSEVLVDAPNANTPGMYDQFRCHWEFARPIEPDKPSWNLEPWRPAVGYNATVQAGCNPGGSEGSLIATPTPH